MTKRCKIFHQPILMIVSVVCMFALALFSIGLYISQSDYRSTLVFATSALAASGIISSTLCVSQSIWANRIYQQKAKSLDYISRWNNPTYLEAQMIVNQIALNTTDLSREEALSIVEHELKEPKTLLLVQRIFNFFEELSMARKVANETMLRDFYIDIIASYCYIFEGWLKEMSQLRIYDESSTIYQTVEIYQPVKDMQADWIAFYPKKSLVTGVNE